MAKRRLVGAQSPAHAPPSSHERPQPAGHPLLAGALVVAVFAVSTSAILARLATISPVVLAAYRLAVSALLLLPWMLFIPRGERVPNSPRLRGLAAASGVFFGAHLALWFASLEETSVASAAVLVTIHPLLIVPASYLLWRERVSGKALLGMAAALLGSALIGLGDLGLGGSHLAGDLLAVAAACAMGAYLLIGSLVRARFPLASYLVWVNAFGAATVFLYGSLQRLSFWPIPPREWVIIGLLAVVPTLMGHTLFNWALRHTGPSVVSVSILGEPVGASILAFLLFGEIPGFWQATGAILILTGVYAFVKGREVAQGSGASRGDRRA